MVLYMLDVLLLLCLYLYISNISLFFYLNLGYVKIVNCCSHELSIGRKSSKRKTISIAVRIVYRVPATTILIIIVI